MKQGSPIFIALVLCIIAASTTAFAPKTHVAKQTKPITLNLFGEEGERKTLTRENEPEEFFAT